MGFFNNIGKTVSDVGQKGKDLAGVAKLNRQISEEQRHIDELYQKAGEKYYQMYALDKDSVDLGFWDLFQTIDEGYNRIKGFEIEIDKIQGIVRCTKCGESVPVGAVFCPKCGKTIEPEVPVRDDKKE